MTVIIYPWAVLILHYLYLNFLTGIPVIVSGVTSNKLLLVSSERDSIRQCCMIGKDAQGKSEQARLAEAQNTF